MVKLSEILAFLEALAPTELAESYDNVGLLVGKTEREVNTVLVALDVDENVAEESKRAGADLIISHHPLIFNPLKNVTDKDSVSRTVMSLIKNDITLFSMHTNFDSVNGGLGDLFLEKIANTKNKSALSGDKDNGIGRIADACDEITLLDILTNIKSNFNLNTVRYVGNKDRKISKIAVCNGGGASLIYDAKQKGADVYVSGDIKYSQARFAYENDIAFVEIPHYSAEIIFAQYVKNILSKEFKDIKILTSKENTEIWKNF